jgi:hypothetical protein
MYAFFHCFHANEPVCYLLFSTIFFFRSVKLYYKRKLKEK